MSVQPQTLAALLNSLGRAERQALTEFQARIAASKHLEIPEEVAREHQTRLQLRLLKSTFYNVEAAVDKLALFREAVATHNIGRPEDSLKRQRVFDQHGCVFPCGHDKHGNICLVMRPCAHLPQNQSDSDEAVNKVYHTLMLCADCLPPGHQKMSVIFDVEGLSLSRNMDMRFVKGLQKHFASIFCERFGKVYVVNNGLFLNAPWNIVKAILHPECTSRVEFCGSNFEKLDKTFLRTNPYVSYLYTRSKLRGKAKDNFPLPAVLEYSPLWKDSLAEDSKSVAENEKSCRFLEEHSTLPTSPDGVHQSPNSHAVNALTENPAGKKGEAHASTDSESTVSWLVGHVAEPFFHKSGDEQEGKFDSESDDGLVESVDYSCARIFVEASLSFLGTLARIVTEAYCDESSHLLCASKGMGDVPLSSSLPSGEDQLEVTGAHIEDVCDNPGGSGCALEKVFQEQPQKPDRGHVAALDSANAVAPNTWRQKRFRPKKIYHKSKALVGSLGSNLVWRASRRRGHKSGQSPSNSAGCKFM